MRVVFAVPYDPGTADCGTPCRTGYIEVQCVALAVCICSLMDGFFRLSSFQEFQLEAFGVLGCQPGCGFENARLVLAAGRSEFKQ